MRTTLSILFASVFSITCIGQTLENDSLKLDIKRKKFDENQILNQYPPLKERNIFDTEPSLTDKPSTNSFENNDIAPVKIADMNINVPKFYQGPPDTYLSSSLNPFANDYAYYSGYTLTDKSWLNTSSTHETYLGIGSLTEITARYNYLLSDNLSVSAGSYIAKYSIGHWIKNDAGVNTSLKYSISDRVSFHAFGQYSFFAKKHGFDATHQTGMYPQTNYGGAFEYKVTDRFGVIGGMSRELNPMTGKWKNVPFLSPVFYSK